MLIYEKYPKLFAQVAGVIGVDKAEEELSKVCISHDGNDMACCFVFANTQQGHNFWWDIYEGSSPHFKDFY
ncbi:MAG: hypothetical protein ACRCUS_00930 [Anaerovoracaceae bacterium]